MSPSVIERTYEDMQEKVAYIPENYVSTRAGGVETAGGISPQDVFLGRIKSYYTAPMWRIQKETKKYYTPKSISVRVYQDEDFFFAENDTLAVCGSGDSPQEALRDLGLHIIHFFEYYKGLDESQLIGDAIRLKQIYEDLLVEQ
ncbi:MAG: hypothetical protein ABIH08_00865 [Candidatus Omnitrophota bacterium]